MYQFVKGSCYNSIMNINEASKLLKWSSVRYFIPGMNKWNELYEEFNNYWNGANCCVGVCVWGGVGGVCGGVRVGVGVGVGVCVYVCVCVFIWID